MHKGEKHTTKGYKMKNKFLPDPLPRVNHYQ